MSAGSPYTFDPGRLHDEGEIGNYGFLNQNRLQGRLAMPGAPRLLYSVLADFSQMRSVSVSSEAVNVLVSLVMELTQDNSLGGSAGLDRRNNVRFGLGAVQMVAYLDYILARLEGREDQWVFRREVVQWLLSGLDLGTGQAVTYVPLNRRGFQAFSFEADAGREARSEIDAVRVVAWLPDFARRIDCPCWPV